MQAFLTLESRDERAKSAAAIRDRTDPAVEVCAETTTTGGSSAGNSEFLVSASRGAADVMQNASPADQLSAADFDALVKHHRGSLRGKFQQLRAVLPAGFATQGAGAWSVSQDVGFGWKDFFQLNAYGFCCCFMACRPPVAAEPGIQTTVEGELRVACAATLLLWRAHSDVVHGIEEMLRSQLVEAIGSVVTASDFAK